METGALLAFLGASVLLTLMPGPDILFVIAQSLAGGRRHGSAIALGLCTGLLVHISAAALGVSALVYSSPYALAVVKTAGALYLFYLAWLSVKPRGEARQAEETAAAAENSRVSFFQLYRRGILMNVLNPKVSLFFLAFLPSFVKPGGGPVPLQMFVLGGLFLLQALVIFHLVAWFAGQAGTRYLRTGAAGRRRLVWLEAALYAALGALLLFG